MSNSGLYGSTGNVTVSAKNLTTLYSSIPGGTVVTEHVPDRNFTTLYSSSQADIQPTRPYGNANVESFLNTGTDGSNTVQNINMSGTLTVGGQSLLGPVGNVHITGGNNQYVLSTDGSGNLSWVEPTAPTALSPYIHFDVTATANNQSFTDANLVVYGNSFVMNVFKNGVNIEPFFYEKTADDTLQVNILLADGDTIDVLSSGSGITPNGATYDVQFNSGVGTLQGDDSFTYDPSVQILTTPKLKLLTGSNNKVLFTDSTGNVQYSSGFVPAMVTDLLTSYEGSISPFNPMTLHFVDSAAASSFVNDKPAVFMLNDTDITGRLWSLTYLGNPILVDPTSVTFNLGFTLIDLGAASGSLDISYSSGIEPSRINANISDVIINGGANGQVLTTYGNGTVHWATGGGGGTPGGNVNTLQFNNAGNFDGANITYTFDTGYDGFPVSMTHFIGNTDANIPAHGPYSQISFDQDGGVATGNGAIIGGNIWIGGNVAFNESIPNWVSGSGFTVDLGNVAGVRLSSNGSANGNVLATNGSNTVYWTNKIENANIANTVSVNAQPNITSTGTLTSLTVADNLVAQGNVTIQRAFEPFTVSSTGSSSTINYDVLNQSIVLDTANATANFTLNFRGNSTTSLNTILPVNDAVTVVYINTVGSTAYVANVIQIDGTPVTPIYLNGVPPTSGVRLTAAKQSYTYTIMKTAANTYTVLGSLAEFK